MPHRAFFTFVLPGLFDAHVHLYDRFAPLEVVENLQSMEEEGGEIYESIEEIWPDYPTEEDYLWNEDEY